MPEGQPRNKDEKSNAVLRAWFADNPRAWFINRVLEAPENMRELKILNLIAYGVITVEESGIEGVDIDSSGSISYSDEVAERLGVPKRDISSDEG